MSDGANSGLSPVPGLTDAERTLLTLVHDGRMDAEIAVRLGLPTGEVKARIEALCSKLGAKDRAGLRDGVQQADAGANQAPGVVARPATGWSRAVIVALTALVACALVAISFVAGRQSADTSAPTVPSPAATQTVALGVQLATPTQAGTATPTIAPVAVANGRSMYELGQLFSVGIERVQEREGATVVTLAQAGVVLFSAGVVDWQIPGNIPPGIDGFLLFGSVAGTGVVLNIQAADDNTRMIFGANSSAAFYSNVPGAPPALIIAAHDQATVFSNRHITFDSAGRLLLAAKDTPISAVMNGPTGEQLDVSSAAKLPALTPYSVSEETQENRCSLGGCRLGVFGDVFSPFAGTVGCVDGVTRLVGPEFTLVLTQIDYRDGSVVPCEASPPQPLGRGELALPLDPNAGGPEVSALASDGTPLSIVTGEDGTVYVGKITVHFSCPCLRGS